MVRKLPKTKDVYIGQSDSTWFILIVLIAVVGVLISNTLEIHTLSAENTNRSYKTRVDNDEEDKVDDSTLSNAETFEGTLVASQTYQFNNSAGVKSLKLSSDGVNMYYDVASNGKYTSAIASNGKYTSAIASNGKYTSAIASIPYNSSMNQHVTSTSDVEFKSMKVPEITTKTGNLYISSATNVINMQGYDIPAVVWSSIKDLTTPLVDIATFNATESQIAFGQLAATAPQGVKYSFKHTSTATPTQPIDQTWSADYDVLVIQSSSVNPSINMYGPDNSTFNFNFSTPTHFKNSGIRYFNSNGEDSYMAFDVNGVRTLQLNKTNIVSNVPVYVSGLLACSSLQIGNGAILDNITYSSFTSTVGGATGLTSLTVQYYIIGKMVSFTMPEMVFTGSGTDVTLTLPLNLQRSTDSYAACGQFLSVGTPSTTIMAKINTNIVLYKGDSTQFENATSFRITSGVIQYMLNI